MESIAESNQNIHFKTELFDDYGYHPEDRFENVDISATVKTEEPNIAVVLERYPWEHESIPSSQINSMAVHTPYEYDENPTIKTEIEIDEPKLEQQIEDHNNPKPDEQKCFKNKKRKNIVQNKSRGPKLKKYHCQICGKDFAEKGGLERHSNFHPSELPFRCRVCMIRFSHIDQMKAHETICTRQRFECYLCRFTSLHWHWNRFLVHFRKHTGEMPFECQHCTKRFSSNRMLKFHMKYHPKEVQSTCSFCQRIFPSSGEAKKHESQCAIQRKWECFLCKSTFTYRSSLLRHMPQHSGSHKFKCAHCNNAYTRKDYLDMHNRIHHALQSQFQCPQCEKGFSQKSKFNAHTRVCTKKLFKCDVCTFTTKSEAYADDHKQKHIGMDEFKCRHCSAVFFQRSQLLKHVKIHNKKDPFYCQHCQKVYHHWINLEKHRQKCPKAPCTSSSAFSCKNDNNIHD